MSLRRRAAFSVLWNIVRLGLDQLFNLAIFVVMSRYLTPASFGIFIVSLIFSEFGRIIASGSLVNSLYRAPIVTDQIADTVFWSNMALAIAFAGLGWIFCNQIAALLGSALASPIIGALGFTVPISALGACHMSRHLRDFGHRSLAVRSVLSGVLGGAAAVLAAMHGYGVWALVVQRFVQESITTVVAWVSFRWRPGLQFSWPVLVEQSGLASGVALSQVLMLALARSQDLIIVRVLGLTATGIYRTAWKTNDVISQGIITPFSNVAVSVFAKVQDDIAALRRIYLNMISVATIFSFPLLVSTGILAHLLIPLVYGPQWHASIPVARVLTLLVVPISLNLFAAPALVVLGKGRLIAELAVIQLVTTIAFCAAAAPFGLTAIACAYTVRAYLTLALQLWMFQRETGIRASSVLKSLAPQLAAATVMGCGLFVATAAYERGLGAPTTQAGIGLELLALVCVAVTFYATALSLFLGKHKRAIVWQTIRTRRLASILN